MKIDKKDKILISGGNGMLGKAINKILHKNGYKRILSPSRNELDFKKIKKLDKYFKKNNPQYIIMSAAKVGGILDNSSKKITYLEENLEIQDNFFKIIKKYKIKKSVFISSSCIYPKLSPQPINEKSFLSGKLEETNEGFALAKIIGIKKAEYYFKEYGLLTICPVICNLYGPNDNYDLDTSHVFAALIKKFLQAIKNKDDKVILWGTGKPIREFMYVEDAARAVVFLFENYNSTEIINVGTGVSLSIKSLSKKIALECNFIGRIIWDNTKSDGMIKKCLNISKLSKLKYRSNISIESGIKKTIYDFKKNNDLAL